MSCIRDKKFEPAYKLYLDGLSLAQVGAKIGVSRQTIYEAFKRRKYPLRGPNFKPEQSFDGKKFTLRCNGYYSLTIDDRLSMHRYIWQHYNGPIPNGYDIHHKDEYKANNDLSNLECLPKSEHTRLYSPHNNQYTRGRKKPAK